ncbi:hypothetical protein ACHAQH_009599 [Verticillium albo-atrum]
MGRHTKTKAAKPLKMDSDVRAWRHTFDDPAVSIEKIRSNEYFEIGDDTDSELKLGRPHSGKGEWDDISKSEIKSAIRPDLHDADGRPFDDLMKVRVNRAAKRLTHYMRTPQLSNNTLFRRRREGDKGDHPLTLYRAAKTAMNKSSGTSHDSGWIKAGGYEIFIRQQLWPAVMAKTADRISQTAFEVRPPPGR